ncbi:MAG: cell division protein FtsQ/DivIB [Burkholderiaceae bacterium]
MTDALVTPFDVRLMNITANALFVVFGAVLLAALGSWAANRATFSIGLITVTGDVTHNSAATLRANVVPKLGGSFLTLDLAHAKQVFESLPWVRRAIVQRQFPNRLKVVLHEQQPVAYWGAEGDSRLLNNFGEVFEANIGEVEREGLPHLDGPAGQGPQVLAMFETLQPLFETLDLSLEQLKLTGRGSWEALLDNGAQIEIGRGTDEEVVARTERFLKTVTQITSRYNRRPDAVESADLRHANGYALRMRGVSTVVPEVPKK